jgi:serine/threonine protein kinase
MPGTPQQDYDWRHRYVNPTSRNANLREPPVTTSIDHEWRLIKSLADPCGAFNNGIDLVDHRETGELAVRKKLRIHDFRHVSTEKEIRLWMHEMLVLRKLRHPHTPYYCDGWADLDRGLGSIYMEPCRLGSVRDFVRPGRHLELLRTKREYLLWHILHGVAEAILYMQTGYKTLAEANRRENRHRPMVKGWVCLVHCDIRPDQIFLNDTQTSRKPLVRLGDFGCSQFMKPWHDSEPYDGDLIPHSTKPPEFPAEMSRKTDVFALGAVAQMYAKYGSPPGTAAARGYFTDEGYTTMLDDLVYSLVARYPSDRPSIREVLAVTGRALEIHEECGVSLSGLPSGLFDKLWSWPTGGRW